MKVMVCEYILILQEIKLKETEKTEKNVICS